MLKLNSKNIKKWKRVTQRKLRRAIRSDFPALDDIYSDKEWLDMWEGLTPDEYVDEKETDR